jgi:hypothetical protein
MQPRAGHLMVMLSSPVFVAMLVALPAFPQSTPKEARLESGAVGSSSARFGSESKALAPGSYVGDDGCRACHQEKFESYSRTAHHLTSEIASRESIAGKFGPGESIFKTANPELFFKVEATDQGQFQIAVTGIPPDTTSRSERFDIVIGSGRKGQSYLFWKGDQLFQLPLSFWTELGQWVNSPGYRDGFADFSRRVPPRCLECHATYFESLSPPLNRYSKTSFLLRLACERCHGPGKEHVARYTAKSDARQEPSIVNPARLSRDRQMDVCALCHAGMGEPARAPAFSFVVGERLEDYLTLLPASPDAKIDVHGSQVELLKRSRCYQSSKTMTCSTCHDVHAPQRDAASFSARCLSCHKVENCGVYPKMGRQIADNCVDCHMPKQQTELIVSDSNGRKVKPQVRNHQIRIYEENRAR